MEEREQRDEQRAARGVAFHAWFGAMSAYFGRKVVPEVEDVYAKALAHIPVADLEAIFHHIISRADAPKRDIPRVAVLLKNWNDYRERHEPRRPVDTTDEFERQRRILLPLVRAALSHGARALGDDAGPEWALTIARYVGQQFDRSFPGGCGAHPADYEAAFAMANQIYRDEVAANYQLAPCEA